MSHSAGTSDLKLHCLPISHSCDISHKRVKAMLTISGEKKAMRKPFMPYANNKGADQPAHPRSLISAFVVRCLDSVIPLVSIS